MEKTEAMKNTGLKLMVARKQAGLTQKQLADRVECSSKWISMLELGDATPSAHLVKRIEDELTKELSKERIRIFETL